MWTFGLFGTTTNHSWVSADVETGDLGLAGDRLWQWL
jgi:hypothetical protein